MKGMRDHRLAVTVDESKQTVKLVFSTYYATGVLDQTRTYTLSRTRFEKSLDTAEVIIPWRVRKPAEKWWISTDMIGKPGSPTVGDYYSTRDDALTARTLLEVHTSQTYSVFSEAVS